MDHTEGEEIVVTARLDNQASSGGGGGGGWSGGWSGGWGGGWGGAVHSPSDPWGSDDLVFEPGVDVPAEATNPVYEVPQPEEHLPYTVEDHSDGTTVVRAYDFWTGQMSFVSIGPDGEVFTGSQSFDVNDWSTQPYLNFPASDWGSPDLV